MNSQLIAVIEPVVLLLLAGLGYLIWKSVKAKKEDQAMRMASMETSARFIAAVEKLAEVTDGLGKVPKIIEGNFKICEALVVEVGKLRMTNQEFRAMLIPPTDPKQALQQTSEEESASVFDIASLISSGMDPDAAISRVRANRDREAQFSGVSMERE